MTSRPSKLLHAPVADAVDYSSPPRGPTEQHPISILLLEDDARDTELIRHTLRKAGIPFRLVPVDTKTAFIRQLVKSPPDLILSDYSMPSFDGISALEIASRKCPDTPFIFVTGTLGEEVAIETLKRGATDYVLKHRLPRLIPAVNRALIEAEQRAERRKEQQKLRESHEQLHTLSTYLQHVRERERTRIAREVHDVLGQALTGLKLQLTWLTNRLPRKSRRLHRKAHEMAGYIDETIETVRRIATELRPGVLDNAGLSAALEWQASQFEQRTGIRCRVKSDVKETFFNQDLNTAFFRIFQEALTNITRHSGATAVEVELSKENGSLVLEINDNGRGVSEAEVQNTRSIGLLGMRERASLLHGELHVSGRPGRGTTVRVRIPVPSPRPDPDHQQRKSSLTGNRQGK